MKLHLMCVVAALAACGGVSAESWPLTTKIAEAHKVLGTDTWYGCRRTVFDFEGYEAWVVEPPEGVKAAEGNPWTWTMQWATAYVPRTSVPRLVKERGWRHATVITYKDKMDQHGLEVSARFQRYLVDGLGFAKKANLIGMSWGGFYSVRYAATYPENVAKAYLDAPLLCFADFDPSKESANPRHGPWAQMAPKDGKWSADPRMPLNLAEKLAATGIPVFLVYGGQDKSCPPEQNAVPFIARFKAAGGEPRLKVLYREYFGHHPHGVEESDNAIIDFFTSDAAKSSKSAYDAALERLRATVHGGEITEIRRYWKGDGEPTWMRGGPDCAIVHFTLRPTPESEIRCRLLLPPPEKWNGRFWGIGNQGQGTDLREWLFRGWQLPHAQGGSATCLADMGTGDGRFGREVLRDFGWRACHLMTVEAKKLVEAFYGRPAKKSYFSGISSGGGQGFHEALRFPEDYDGVVSYVPAHRRTDLARNSRNFYRATHDAAGKLVVTPEQCKAVVDAAIELLADKGPSWAAGKCVTPVTYSREQADAILDRAATKVPALKADDLRARWHAIWRGPEIDGRHSNGHSFGADLSDFLHPRGFMTEILLGKGAKTVQEMTDAEFEAFVAEIRDDVDATDPDLSRFAARGGKMIVISGTADPIVPARSAWDTCEQLAAKVGGKESLASFFRAYFLPGRDHGYRPKDRDGVGNVDAFGAIVKWCEEGVAPGALKGSLRDGTSVPVEPWGK